MNEKLNDETYERIKVYALSQMAKLKNANHNDAHVIRVKDNALKIVRILGIENKVDENLLKTISLLHDFTYTVRKPSIYTYIFEGHIERRIIRGVLEKFNLSEETKKVVIDAVFHHTHSFPFGRLNKKRSAYTKVLQDADTLDFFDCLRIKTYMRENNKGIFKDTRNRLGSKLIEYGINNLEKFLNYPMLAKSFFTDSSKKCI